MTTYYVDATGGADGNDGITTGTAWQTIAKVNGETFNPGDGIMFNRGETWTDATLTPPSSGSAGNHIVFDAYGFGGIPKIDGSAFTTGALLIADDTKHHLTFNNIWFSGATGANNHTAKCYTHDLYFYQCDFSDSAAHHGFGAWSATGVEIYNITLEACNFYDNYESGLFIGAGGSPGNSNCLIFDCVARDNGHSNSADHGFYINYDTVVQDCLAYNNCASGFKVDATTVTRYPVIERNLSYSPGNSPGGAHQRFGIFLGASDCVVQNNICGIGTSYLSGFGIYMIGSDDCVVYHNTVVNCTQTSLRIITGVTGCNIKNNVFLQDKNAANVGEWSSVCINVDDADILDNNTFDYNLEVYIDAGGNRVNQVDTNYYNWAAWQGLPASPDPNSVNDNPDFVTDYTDLHLQSISPCRNVGTAVGVTDDYDGNSRPQELNPAIGAFEFTPRDVYWGHITGVTEEDAKTFVNNWTGSATIVGSGDGEQVCISAGEEMFSEIVFTGLYTVALVQNVYDGTGDDVTLAYRHSGTVAGCQAASWVTYSTPFTSLGYVQVRTTPS